MKRQRGNSLAGVLVAVAIIGVAVAVYFTGGFGMFGAETALPERADGQGKTTVGRAAARAKDEVCRSNIRQVRMSIQVSQTTEETPMSLADIPLGDEFKRCSITPNEAYVYDPSSGRVTCPHPGHESF